MRIRAEEVAVAGEADEGLPEYASMLAAYHAAFAGELRAMVASLGVGPGMRVLDVACGDGVYSGWLAERVGQLGGVWAVDCSEEYLALAEGRRRRRSGGGDRVQFLTARLERLPFAEGSFDLVWCAQSLFSLPDPVEAVRRMAAMARPGGVVAVLEDDTLHQVLLPWPVEVELAARVAELEAFAAESDKPRKFYVGRGLTAIFRAAGLEDCRRRTWASDRQAPLGRAERAFLAEYLRDLHGRVAPRLEPAMRARLDALVDEGSGRSLLDWPELAMTVVDHVVRGVRPG